MTGGPIIGTDPTNRLLLELIERPSVTPDDCGCQDLLAQRLEVSGFTCEAMPFGSVSNLWARRGTEPPVLCFAGHTDVVPPGPLDAWASAPFSPSARDGKIFGRGAADMKSGLAAMVIAAERLVERHPNHRGSLAFLITSDEEGPARDGTLKVIETLTDRGDSIDWCVVGEPSSAKQLGDTVRIGRRGSLSGQLTIEGKQGHVAYPHLADNPIRRLAPALHELFETTWDEGNDYFPPTTFEVVEIASSAGAPNVIPASLSARFNFRYSTEWHHDELRRQVQAMLDAHDLPYSLTWHLSGEPFLTEPGVLIDATTRAIRTELGLSPELSTGGGTSDGRFIAPSGAQVVELGPVNATIHQVNECIDIEDPPRLAATYLRLAEELLVR